MSTIDRCVSCGYFVCRCDDPAWKPVRNENPMPAPPNIRRPPAGYPDRPPSYRIRVPGGTKNIGRN